MGSSCQDFGKDIAFPWDANQWYRVKFEVKLDPGRKST